MKNYFKILVLFLCGFIFSCASSKNEVKEKSIPDYQKEDEVKEDEVKEDEVKEDEVEELINSFAENLILKNVQDVYVFSNSRIDKDLILPTVAKEGIKISRYKDFLEEFR